MKRWKVALPLLLAAVAGAGYFAWDAAVQTWRDSKPALPVTAAPESWHRFREGSGHVVHVGQEQLACDKCHALDAPTLGSPPAAVCADCHRDQLDVRHADPQQADCIDCHDFGPEAGVQAGDCRRCHARAQGQRVAITGDSHDECGRCHDPHRDPSIAPADCVGCHEAAESTHAAEFASEASACLVCHSVHAPAETAQMRCEGCHQPQQSALTATGHARCSQCHQPHAFAAEDALGCTTCHADTPVMGAPAPGSQAAPAPGTRAAPAPGSQAAPAPGAQAGHARCTTCHRPHANVADVPERRCQACHQRVSPQHPKVDGHTCIGCHVPHPGGAGRAEVPVADVPQAPVGAPSHESGFPLVADDRRMASASGLHAARSQGKPAPAARAAPAVGDCTGCHRALPGLSADAPAADDRAAHGGRAACADCHRPHAFVEPAQTVACARCHGAQLSQTARARAAGHAMCTGCHTAHPHAAEAPAVACDTCHAQVQPRAGHAECAGCHAPHSGAVQHTCADCHAGETRTAGRIAAHAACRSCHGAHDDPRPAASACDDCHADKRRQNHGGLQDGCNACHDVHAERGVGATPACTSCHALEALPGLHGLPDHQGCVDCHGGAHQPQPWSSRATCTGCHDDMTRHVPGAKLCQGCHVFAQ